MAFWQSYHKGVKNLHKPVINLPQTAVLTPYMNESHISNTQCS